MTVRWLGTFLEDPLDVPSEVLEFGAAQLEVANPSKVKRYTERAKWRWPGGLSPLSPLAVPLLPKPRIGRDQRRGNRVVGPCPRPESHSSERLGREADMLVRRYRGGLALAAAALLTGVLAAPVAAAGAAEAAAPASAPRTATMTDLGTLGGAFSQGSAINAQGQVAGYADTASGSHHAFRWTASGGMQDLGTLGGTNSSAVGDQRAGPGHRVRRHGVRQPPRVPVDRVRRHAGSGHARRADQLRRPRSTRRARSPGPLTRRAAPRTRSGGLRRAACGIWARSAAPPARRPRSTRAGQVTGDASTAGGATHAFRWTPSGGMQDLGTLGGTTSVAPAINAQGQVTGFADTAGGAQHAFRWTPSGGMRDLGTLGGTTSCAPAINAQGQVTGHADTAGGFGHAFRWTPSGGMRDLGTLGGPFSYASAINARGQVTGFANTASGAAHAFRWTASGGMRDLGTLGGPSSAAGWGSTRGARSPGSLPRRPASLTRSFGPPSRWLASRISPIGKLLSMWVRRKW